LNIYAGKLVQKSTTKIHNTVTNIAFQLSGDTITLKLTQGCYKSDIFINQSSVAKLLACLV